MSSSGVCTTSGACTTSGTGASGACTTSGTGTSATGTSACGIYEDDLEKLKKDLEKKGEAALQALYQDKGINGSSIPGVLGAINNGKITEQSLTSIMQKGFDEFKATTGRAMSYGEMRELYG